MTDPTTNTPAATPAERAKSRLERMFGRPVAVRPLDGKKPVLPGEPDVATRPVLGLAKRLASIALTLVIFAGAGNVAEYLPRAIGPGYTGWSNTQYGAQLEGWQQTIDRQPSAIQVTILDVDRHLVQGGDQVNQQALARSQMLDQLGWLSKTKVEVLAMRTDLAEGQASQTAAAHCAMGLLPGPHERLSSAIPSERMRVVEQALHKTCGVVLFFNLSTGEDIARSQSFAYDPRYGSRVLLSPESFQDFVITHELAHTMDFNLGGLSLGEHEHRRTLEEQRAHTAALYESAKTPKEAARAAESLYQTMRGESFADGVGLIAHMQKYGADGGLYELISATRTVSSWHARDLSHYTVPVLRAAHAHGLKLIAEGRLDGMSLQDIAREVQDHAMPAAPDRASFEGLVRSLSSFDHAASSTGRVYIAYDSSPERAVAVTAALRAANPAAAQNPYLARFIADYADTKNALFVAYGETPEAERYPAQLRQLLAQRGDTPALRAALIEAQRNELDRLTRVAASISYADPAGAPDQAILAERRAALDAAARPIERTKPARAKNLTAEQSGLRM